MHVCVRERERKRETEQKIETQRTQRHRMEETDTHSNCSSIATTIQNYIQCSTIVLNNTIGPTGTVLIFRP